MSAHVGCENCRKTERTLAQALGIIERADAAYRALRAARDVVHEREQDVRQAAIDAAKWLEEL